MACCTGSLKQGADILHSVFQSEVYLQCPWRNELMLRGVSEVDKNYLSDI